MTPEITPSPLRITEFAFFASDTDLSLLEQTAKRELKSLGLRSFCESWHDAQLLIVRGNVSMAEIDEIATTFRGKEIWTIGSAYTHEEWAAASDKFPTCHLGNLIFTTTIQQLISSPATNDKPVISPTSPAFKLFPNFSLSNTLSTVPERNNGAAPSATTPPLSLEPYIMVVDDNLIVSRLLLPSVCRC
jgi:hypothetical protein